MTPLQSPLRRDLEDVVLDARKVADGAARAALDVLAAKRADAYPQMSTEQRALRTALRARAKALGDGDRDAGWEPLTEEIAYQQWHRMLFARVLAENGLLRHESGISVTLQDCAELAEPGSGEDQWDVAARLAAAMLPGLFGQHDPAVQVRFAPEGKLRLEKLLTDLPSDIFTSDDGLGWVYQFWQKARKDQINDGGRKIGAAEIGPVTQLFTEDYMVRFLLENSLGAWWARKYPHSPLLREWEYLRFDGHGLPAVGEFPAWPQLVAEVTVMDPCCGSGHFLVAAFDMLRKMRMEEEGLGEADAADRVLRDNLFGLDIDNRCSQIATFAVALIAWKSGGHPDLFPPRIACSGIAAGGTRRDWETLGGGDSSARSLLGDLHDLFKIAPVVGSLIEPQRILEANRVHQKGLRFATWENIETAVNSAPSADPEESVFNQAVIGAGHAATLLGRYYTLVITNVPFLGKSKFDSSLSGYASKYFPDASQDLACLMFARSLAFASEGGSVAIVSPQYWLGLARYKKFRRFLAELYDLGIVAKLGAGAFETISGEVVNVSLSIVDNVAPNVLGNYSLLDVSQELTPTKKQSALRQHSIVSVEMSSIFESRDLLIGVTAERKGILGDFAEARSGIQTGDAPRFVRYFWELENRSTDWELLQGPNKGSELFGGRSQVLWWQGGQGAFHRFLVDRLGENGISAWVRGADFWGKEGVAINAVSSMTASIYSGERFSSSVAVLVPKESSNLSAVIAFCRSEDFKDRVREVNTKVSVDARYFEQVPFDPVYWNQIAEEQEPLPPPFSNDPTQWLFQGEPSVSADSLQVAVARLLNYRWLDQVGDALDAFADQDGIVCMNALGGDHSAAERLRALLAVAYGNAWSAKVLDQLLTDAGFGGKSLEKWLTDRLGFFAQHCKLFRDSPFIWQIWDGQPGGFSALINYHKLTPFRLDKLIHTYLGDWITTQRRLVEAEEPGADGRLAKALELRQKLLLIRQGEHPYDIYVRWKPLHEQPIGWDPDLNDGVAVNIRPFLMAGVIRAPVKGSKAKDGGANPPGSDVRRWAAEAQSKAVNRAEFGDCDGSERFNNIHLTLATKRAARKEAAQAG